MSLDYHQISLEEAAELTRNFRTLPVPQLVSLLGTKACSLPNDAIQPLLDQSGCVSVRFYFGVKLESTPQLTIVAVGVDANGNDMTTGIILDRSDECPPKCSAANPLNQ